jgi:hypothetical protein
VTSALLKLLLVCPWRKGEKAEQSARLDIYLTDLEGFPVPTIERACDAYRKRPESKFFPAVGELVELCRELDPKGEKPEEIRYAEGRKLKENAEFWRNTARRSDMARDAARDGWAWSLKLHCLDHGKLPEGAALNDMRTWALHREQKTQAGLKGLPPDLYRTALIGFDRIKTNERETQSEIGRALERRVEQMHEGAA